MKSSKRILVIILLISPLTALAHGEQAIVPFLIEFVGLIAVVVILFSVKLNIIGKLILGGT